MSKDVINVQIKDDADRRKDIDSLFNRLESSDVADWMVEHVRHSSLSFRLFDYMYRCRISTCGDWCELGSQ